MSTTLMMIKRFWKWLGLLVVIPIAYGATLVALPPNIPVDLQLKVPQENIGPHRVVVQFDHDVNGKPIQSTRREHVSYKYRSENPSQLFSNEVLDKRTINTVTQSLGDNKFVSTGFLGQRFYKKTHEDVWYDVLHSTTTVDAFNSQMGISWFEEVFVKKAFADDTGFIITGSGANDSTVGTTDWADPTSAQADDDDSGNTCGCRFSGGVNESSVRLFTAGTVEGDEFFYKIAVLEILLIQTYYHPKTV